MKLCLVFLLGLLLVGVWSSNGLSLDKGDKDKNEMKIFDDDPFPILNRLAKREVDDAAENEVPVSETEEDVNENLKNDEDGNKNDSEDSTPFNQDETSSSDSTEAETQAPQEEAETELLSEEEDAVTIFALANTDVGRNWEGIPFREKYLWFSDRGPCHSFDLSVPHEDGDHGTLSICLYRREVLTKNSELLKVPEMAEYLEEKSTVYGIVKGYNKSNVFGHLKHNRFTGEISLKKTKNGNMITYVVEDSSILAKLMGHSSTLLRNLHLVMSTAKGHGTDVSPNLNAVVTTGTSLETFVNNAHSKSKPKHASLKPFLALSTGHNSYIIPGEPQVEVDEKGKIVLTVGNGNEEVAIDIDGSVILSIKSKEMEYKFRPNQKSILVRGLNVTKLEDNTGPISVTAVSDKLSYGCILPSPAFNSERNAGFTCKVCVGVDKSFLTKYSIGSRAKIQWDDKYEFIEEVMDRVSWIFRSVDWNGDGTGDNIGIAAEGQIFPWEYDDDGEEVLSTEGLHSLFADLRKFDFSECCLGVVYTMKEFPGEVFAKSSASKSVSESGICAMPKENVSNNVILISANSKDDNSPSMSRKQLTYLTAHEIGKAFGAYFDTTGDGNCDSFQDSDSVTRHFILWPDPLRETITAEYAFSPCSIDNVKKSMDSCKSSCFEFDPAPFCGNGIVEMGEECDCGSEIECSKQECCFSRHDVTPCQKTGLSCKKAASGASGKQISIELSLLAAIAAGGFQLMQI